MCTSLYLLVVLDQTRKSLLSGKPDQGHFREEANRAEHKQTLGNMSGREREGGIKREIGIERARRIESARGIDTQA